MKLDNLSRIEELEQFLEGNQHLKRRDKGVVIQFLLKISGYSLSPLERLIARHKQSSSLIPKQKTVNGFEKIYTDSDIATLVELDNYHDTPNGLRVKKLCERAYYQFGDEKYQRLAAISVSHIDNLRQSSSYKKNRYHYEKTSEAFLIPALEILLDAFPFHIINFHSDNGSEYVNKTVAKLLSK